MIVLGIDPGLASTGFGIIRCSSDGMKLLRCGYIRTLPGHAVAVRLFQIHNDMEELIIGARPDMVAVENAFSLVKYPKAGILLGGVLGVVAVAAQRHGLSLIEIGPKEVKNALVGFGSADKEQVAEAVRRRLGVDGIKSFHAADALAVALTAYYRRSGRGTAA